MPDTTQQERRPGMQVGRRQLEWALAKTHNHGGRASPGLEDYVRIRKQPADGADGIYEPEISLTAADGAFCEVRVRQPVDEPHEGGLNDQFDVVLPLETLGKIVRELPEGPVELAVSHAEAHIIAGGFRAAIQGSLGHRISEGEGLAKRIRHGADPERAPGPGVMSAVPGEPCAIFSADPESMRNAIRSVLHASPGPERGDPEFEGMMLELDVKKTELQVACTDGQCLSSSRLPVDHLDYEGTREHIRCRITHRSAASLMAHMRFAERSRIAVPGENSREAPVEITMSPAGVIAATGADGINRATRISIGATRTGMYPDVAEFIRQFTEAASKRETLTLTHPKGSLAREMQMAQSIHGQQDGLSGEIITSRDSIARIEAANGRTRIRCTGKVLGEHRRIQVFETSIPHEVSQTTLGTAAGAMKPVHLSTRAFGRMVRNLRKDTPVSLTITGESDPVIIEQDIRTGAGKSRRAAFSPVRHISVLISLAGPGANS